MIRKIGIAIVTVFFIIGCQNKDSKPQIDTELEELFALMQGSFNSEIQSKQDSTYYNISLHMYPIWEDKGKFLYVEQALNTMQDKPYRQRIYELSRTKDSLFKSEIYTLEVDSLWIGKWKTPTAFDSISKSDITLKNGCAVILSRIGKNHYKGETDEKTCLSKLRGASYATSQVEIKEGKIISWDRGFDAEGNQVWGAVNGGYVFDKINP